MIKSKTGFPSIDRTHLKNVPKDILNPIIHSCSMMTMLEMMTENRMDLPSVTDEYGEWNRSDIIAGALEKARILVRYGLRPGASSIAVAMPNSHKLVELVMGANAIAVQVFFLNFLDDKQKLLEDAKKLGNSLLFYYDEVMYTWSGMKPSEVFNSIEATKTARYAVAKYRFYEEPLIFLQTSGSTSEPKILPFTNSAIYAAMIYSLHSTGIDNENFKDRKLMTILSARMPFGFMTGFLPIIWGMEVVYVNGAKPEDIAKYHSYEATYIFGTPILLRAFMQLTPKDADLSALKGFYSSGLETPEALYPEAKKFFEEHNSHAKVMNNYGFGEGLGIGTASDQVEHRPGTSGIFYYGPEFVIVDDKMHEVKYGEKGELIVNSVSLCRGYLNNRKATSEAFIRFNGETFFRTGDYVSLDEDGYVHYYGRLKRFYHPLGSTDKVSCEMVEKTIQQFPFVEQVSVVASPDKNGYEIGKAFIVLKSGTVGDEKLRKEMLTKLRDGMLKDFQIPAKIAFLDKLPVMASGKIDLQKLKEM